MCHAGPVFGSGEVNFRTVAGFIRCWSSPKVIFMYSRPKGRCLCRVCDRSCILYLMALQ